MLFRGNLVRAATAGLFLALACDGSTDDAGETCMAASSTLPLPGLGQRRCDGLEAGQTWDPSRPGPYPVGVKTLLLANPLRPGRTLTTEVWYPADESARGQQGETCFLIATSAVRDAPMAKHDPTAGLVVFSHGYRGLRCQSTFLTLQLASHGYVVAAPDHSGNTLGDPSSTDEQAAVDRVEDMSQVTTEMISRANSADDFFAGSFDVRRVGWTGHSFGASTVLMAGAFDNREIVDVSLAPAFDDRMAFVYNPASYDLRAALVVIGGTDDGTEPFQNQQLAYDRTNAPRYLVTLKGGKHFDFTDLCSTPLKDSVPEFKHDCSDDPEAAHQLVNTVVTAALGRYLRCDPHASRWLDTKYLTAQSAFGGLQSDPGNPSISAARETARVCDVDAKVTGELQSVTVQASGGPSIHVAAQAADDKLPAVLLVHGFSTTSAVFSHQLERLSSRYRMLALDLRGHGASDVDPDAPFGPDGAAATADDPYTLAHFADDVETTIDQLALVRPVLVGWSSGAQVAMEVARRRGGDLRGLVVVDGTPLTAPDPAVYPDYNAGGTLGFARDLRLGLMSADQSETTWRPLVRDLVRRDAPASLADAFMSDFLTVPPDTRTGQIETTRPDLLTAVDTIAVPTLVVHGEQDDALLLESANYLHDHIQGSQLVVFQRSGHAPFQEEPERFDQELVRFIDALPQ